MRRHLFTILSGLSLVLCVAVGVLWLQSHLMGHDFARATVLPEQINCHSPFGIVAVQRIHLYRMGSVSGRLFYGQSYYTARPHHIRHQDGPWSHTTQPPNDSWPVQRAFGGWGTWWDHLGFGGLHATWSKGWTPVGQPRPDLIESDEYIWFPYWPLWLATTILPTIFLVRSARDANRRRSVARSVCANCGYDLRATPERCPECGRVPEPRYRPSKVVEATT